MIHIFEIDCKNSKYIIFNKDLNINEEFESKEDLGGYLSKIKTDAISENVNFKLNFSRDAEDIKNDYS